MSPQTPHGLSTDNTSSRHGCVLIAVSCDLLIRQAVAARTSIGLKLKEYVDQNTPGKAARLIVLPVVTVTVTFGQLSLRSLWCR